MASDASTQLYLSHEGGSCSVGREIHPPDLDTTLSRVSQRYVTQPAGHDTAAAAEDRALGWTTSSSARLHESVGALADRCGERSGVTMESSALPWRADERSAGLGGSAFCDNTITVYRYHRTLKRIRGRA